MTRLLDLDYFFNLYFCFSHLKYLIVFTHNLVFKTTKHIFSLYIRLMYSFFFINVQNFIKMKRKQLKVCVYLNL